MFWGLTKNLTKNTEKHVYHLGLRRALGGSDLIRSDVHWASMDEVDVERILATPAPHARLQLMTLQEQKSAEANRVSSEEVGKNKSSKKKLTPAFSSHMPHPDSFPYVSSRALLFSDFSRPPE